MTTSSAINGAASRLGALLAGRFGAVLIGDGPELDLEEAAETPGITYINLPATASVQDVPMVGRVLLADFKLVAHSRLTRGGDARPCLLVIDEFLSLGDPEAIQDLLRQTREARMPTVTASQYLNGRKHCGCGSRCTRRARTGGRTS